MHFFRVFGSQTTKNNYVNFNFHIFPFVLTPDQREADLYCLLDLPIIWNYTSRIKLEISLT